MAAPTEDQEQASTHESSHESDGMASGEPDILNPLLVDLVIRKIAAFLNFKSLLTARLVCKAWNKGCRTFVQNQGCITFHDSPHDNSDPCNCAETCKATKPKKFQQYLNDFSGRRLPFHGDSSDSLLFRNLKFITTIGPSRHPSLEAILYQLAQVCADDVQGISFQAAGHVPIFEEQSTDRRCWFLHCDWRDSIGRFCNLRTLELIGLPRDSTVKCLTELRKLLEGKILPGRVKKLSIRPRHSVEFELTRFVHVRYIDLLARVVSLMPIEEFALSSHLNAEELPHILRNIPRLRTLLLERFVHVAAHVQMFQNVESSIFPLKLPHLERLEIPNVYFQNLEEINRNIPGLRKLKIKYQPLMIYAEGTEDNEPECAGVRLDFSLIIVDRPVSNENMEEVEWAVDSAGNVLNNYDIGINDVCDITLFGISCLYPKLKKLKAFVSSADDIRMIFSRYSQLEELIIAEESSYSATDEDFVGSSGLGIRALTELKVLRLLNDNTGLTPDSFRNGFLCLPNLHSLEIRHAPTLLRYTLYAQKEQWNPLLTNVEISKD